VPANLLSDTRAVFFDAVGTLFFPDPPAPEIYSAVAAHHGLRVAPDAVRTRFLAAYRKEEEVDRAAGWITSEARETMRWRRIVGESLDGVRSPEACFRELFQHFGQPSAWRMNPQAPKVMQDLHFRGFRLGIGSNYDARLFAVVAGFPELAPLRDRVVISARVGYRKPASEFFREMARAADFEPGEIVFVGDDVDIDYEGARRAGLRAILLAPGRQDSGVQSVVTDLQGILE